MEKLMQVGEGAEAFLESLKAHGVDHIFINPGIDTTPVQGAIAKYRALGKPAPRLVFCPDESVAFAAAHGYAMVSGRPQVVMVYMDVGTLQVGGPLTNAYVSRTPIILCAGRSSNDHLDWRQVPYDQGGIVRNYVKWDHELRPGESISHTLEQAFQIASTEPCGLIYLCMPREVLWGKIGELIVAGPSSYKASPASEIDLDALSAAAEILIQAENPLILTAASGRHHEAVAELVELAETLAARVISTEFRMSFPSTHPLCAGIDSAEDNYYNQFIEQPDVLLLIDYDPPGPRPRIPPRADAKIVVIDIDPVKQKKPLWGRRADVLIQADSSKVLPALNGIARQLLASKPDPRISDRSGRLEEEHRRQREEWHSMAVNAASQKPISPEWLCHCLNQVIDDDAIIINMALDGGASVMRQVDRTRPGTLFGPGGGSMGWPFPAGLGAKLAAPDKIVVSLLGDGGFIYGCPTATLWSAVSHEAPFLTVIFNNQSYRAIKGLLEAGFGESSVAGDKAFQLGVEIKDPPDYAAIARACGAHGRMVEDPCDLLPALREAVDRVREGTPAVIDVRI